MTIAARDRLRSADKRDVGDPTLERAGRRAAAPTLVAGLTKGTAEIGSPAIPRGALPGIPLHACHRSSRRLTTAHEAAADHGRGLLQACSCPRSKKRCRFSLAIASISSWWVASRRTRGRMSMSVETDGMLRVN
jgi:hypothetical protein